MVSKNTLPLKEGEEFKSAGGIIIVGIAGSLGMGVLLGMARGIFPSIFLNKLQEDALLLTGQDETLRDDQTGFMRGSVKALMVCSALTLTAAAAVKLNRISKRNGGPSFF